MKEKIGSGHHGHKHGHHGHKHGHGSPDMFKIPCAMKTSWHLNRSPCPKDTFKHPGCAKPCGSPCGPNKFPRWESSYIHQKAAPCAAAVTGNCKKGCGAC
jgi:hypothetical protein